MAAESLANAAAIVTETLMAKLAKSILIEKKNVDVDKPMHQYGVDSLVAVELRKWFARNVSAEVAVFEILGEATFAAGGKLDAGKCTYR